MLSTRTKRRGAIALKGLSGEMSGMLWSMAQMRKYILA
jgi:hypothetical protein